MLFKILLVSFQGAYIPWQISRTILTMMSSAEETMKRISSHKDVLGMIIVDSEYIPVRTTLEYTLAKRYATQVGHLISNACSLVRDIDPQNELTVLRICSKKHEIMVAPENHYLLIVIQKPNSENM